ncbi:hypothetical protein PHLCEN_2v4620 [Hermanssonia centrifuga]|uniref:Uncharacterized protein n=1 Tax=Hermanssonia centrifuga TaxID=98765 RepID=A0A2R6PMS8_9APHY|nr:hypothetical protein PHLCEN_2v4620 [Hermanssonia centrifuga]
MESLDATLVINPDNCMVSIISLPSPGILVNDSQGIIETLLSSQTTLHTNHARIRELVFLEDEDRRYPRSFASLSRELNERHGLDPVLPSIVAMTATCVSTTGFQGAASWIEVHCRSLLRLHMDIGQDVSFDVVIPFLRVLTGKLLHLPSFKLEVEVAHLSRGKKLDVALAIKNLISSMHGLTRLFLPFEAIQPAWEESFNVMSTLPELGELALLSRLPVRPRHTSIESTHSTPSDGFKPLHTLKVFSPFSTCARIVRATSKSILRLELECEEIRDAAEMSCALRAITDFCVAAHPPRLNTLIRPCVLSQSALSAMFLPAGIPNRVLISTLTEVAINIIHGSMECTSWVDFRPLFSARGMKKFMIRYPYSLSYTRDDLLDILGSWPRVQSLCLNPRPSEGLSSAPLPPLDVLTAIACSAPCLEEFCAMLDGRIFSQNAVPPRTWAPNVRLLDLGFSVGSLMMADLVEGKKYIDTLFPGVQLHVEDCSEWTEQIGATHGVFL